MDISDINQVRVIDELGSISKAAERLNVSQPTLSKRLSRLEHHLGVVLFHRHNGGMVATSMAKFIIKEGDRLDGQLKVIERHIRMMATLKKGVLSLGVGPIVEQLFFPEILLEFSRHTQNINLSFKVGSANQLLTWLQNGEIDIAIGPFDQTGAPADFLSMHIHSDDVIVVARKGHPLTTVPGPLAIKELLGYPSIMPPMPGHILSFLGMESEDDFPQIACDNYSTSKSIVIGSDYITGGPAGLFHTELEAGHLVKLELGFEVTWSAVCLTRPESLHIPVIKKILELFTDKSRILSERRRGNRPGER